MNGIAAKLFQQREGRSKISIASVPPLHMCGPGMFAFLDGKNAEFEFRKQGRTTRSSRILSCSVVRGAGGFHADDHQETTSVAKKAKKHRRQMNRTQAPEATDCEYQTNTRDSSMLRRVTQRTEATPPEHFHDVVSLGCTN